MSGISGRKGTIAFAVQSAKGTPATVPAVKFKLSGAPSLMPQKSRGRYNQTDKGQDPGAAFTSSLGVGGDVPVYLHPDGAAFLFAAVMGANVDSGTTPNYTHTQTYADDMLWITCWREVGGVITEKFTDCKLTALKLSGQAGQPIQVTVSVLGLNGKPLGAGAELTALQALNALSSKGYLYPEAHAQIKLNGTAAPIHSIDFGIDRGASAYQSDDYISSDIDPGGRTTTLGFSTRFVSGAVGVTDYYTFFYGPSGAASTSLDPAVSTASFEIKFVRDANTSVDILLPACTYAGMPVNPDPGGNPIEVQVATEVETPSDGVTKIATVTVKDQTALATIL